MKKAYVRLISILVILGISFVLVRLSFMLLERNNMFYNYFKNEYTKESESELIVTNSPGEISENIAENIRSEVDISKKAILYVRELLSGDGSPYYVEDCSYESMCLTTNVIVVSVDTEFGNIFVGCSGVSGVPMYVFKEERYDTSEYDYFNSFGYLEYAVKEGLYYWEG